MTREVRPYCCCWTAEERIAPEQAERMRIRLWPPWRRSGCRWHRGQSSVRRGAASRVEKT